MLLRCRWLFVVAYVFLSLTLLSPTYAVQVAVGSYNGNGGSSLIVTGVGFSPSAVIIKNDGDQQTVVRTSTMSGDVSKEIPAATALVSDRICIA
jgi:hypothetical protein